MKLAVNLSTIFSEVPLLQRFALARAQGFENVEIQFPYTLSITEIQQQLQQHQLQLCLINVPAADLMQGGAGLACVAGREAAFQHAVTQAIDYATQLQVPQVNILAGRVGSEQSVEHGLTTLIDNLKWACPRFSAAGITPLIEVINGHSMPNFLLQTMAQAQQVLLQVQHPALKIQYDCFHIAMMGEDILQCFQQYHADIAHIQFADYPNRHEPNTGTLDFAAFFQLLDQYHYTGFVAAEYLPAQHSQQSFAWQQQFFPPPSTRAGIDTPS
ncbi:hydroxypyruvate isomerase family protein [Acinetobacter larvae]|uniref:Hydroxypyruvate isomerase n=1 Tax=Acinetobacter larvae TaxID=1789224 RepID=A0A1B2M2D5_9GAMM|nr:TIM barrel protein [Acinetobacter larvae]AOA59183.1 hydroxypyruvate isomerase [Acinetobacter larvae]